MDSLATVDRPLLTVIVPVFNEADTIDALLSALLLVPLDKQVVIVDDGSSDRTPRALEKWTDLPGVEVVRHRVNRGKGAAIRTGLAFARGRFTVIQDGDLEYDPQDLARVVAPLRDGTAQVVYGSRYLLDRRAFWRWDSFRWGVALLNLCIRILFSQRLTDEATCYKAFPTNLLKTMDLQCEGFEFCPEVTAKACRLGVTIHEVPISYTPRGMTAGKKIRWSDGLTALLTAWRWRRWEYRAVPARTELPEEESSWQVKAPARMSVETPAKVLR